jgi:predicted phage terminase large subunit-like protein
MNTLIKSNPNPLTNNTDQTNAAIKLALEIDLGKNSLYWFSKLCWSTIEPETPWVDGWHIKLLCDYLEATVRGEVRNLIVNIPLRHAKSVIISIMFPAWVWASGKKSKKFLYASHSEKIAVKHSKICRDLVKSVFYQTRWPMKLAKDGDREDYFRNVHNGFRASFGVNSKVTGESGDWLCVDDSLDADDAYSDATRNAVNEWYMTAFSNRAANPKTVVKIVAAQRLHQQDLPGFLINKEIEDGGQKFEKLILPAFYEGQRYISSIGLNDPRTVIGEPLWPEVYGKEELDNLAAGMTELLKAGQLQQRPTAPGGSVFKKEWVKNRIQTIPEAYACWISWDTASMNSKTADYSACAVGFLLPDYRLLIKQVGRWKLEFPQLKQKIEEIAYQYKDYNIKGILIENKSSGIAAIQELTQSLDSFAGDLVIQINPKGEKGQRAMGASLWFENGSCVLPDPSTEDLFDFEDEFFSFPASRHDDMVDAVSQLVNYVSARGYLEYGYRMRTGK